MLPSTQERAAHLVTWSEDDTCATSHYVARIMSWTFQREEPSSKAYVMTTIAVAMMITFGILHWWTFRVLARSAKLPIAGWVIAGLGLLGAGVGYWFATSFEYCPSERLCITGFPFMLGASRQEDGMWTDYASPVPYVILFLNCLYWSMLVAAPGAVVVFIGNWNRVRK